MSQTTLSNLQAREIIDSRGNPTVAVQIELDSGATGLAMVPSGASTGSLEAVELRDNEADRFLGKGVTRAVAMRCSRPSAICFRSKTAYRLPTATPCSRPPRKLGRSPSAPS